MKFLTNKYLIALTVFLLLILFFDSRNDIFTQLDRKAELQQLEQSKKHYETEIEKTKKELQDLQHSTEALEKVAREKYKLKKPNEDIYLVQ